VELQEAQRRYIACELHDEIGQVLTGLKLVLEMSARAPPAQARSSLDQALALVNDLMARVRDIALELRPAMLDDLGLLPALLWLFERYSTQSNICVTFEHTALERRFHPEVETAAYRIIQEALTNVARHTDVREVAVRVWAGQSTLNLQIEDCGGGFDAAAVSVGTSTGLSGMQERATLLGGRVIVESALGAGTRLQAELPLGEPKQ
jgi:signal transduction histidine kinase